MRFDDRIPRLLPASLIGVALATAPLTAQWSQWRGPNRDGVVPAASVPAVWPAQLALKWKQPVGEGYSSPVVADGRVFVHSRTDPDEIVSAFDLATGKPIWSARYGSSFTKNQYATAMSKGPFSTPLVANGRVFTLGTSAVLSSFDAATGTLEWRKSWPIDTSKLFTGTAMSPVIDSGLLIVHVGDDTNGAFRAFDPMTGAEKWTLPGHGPGYASPIVRVIGGTRHLITMTDGAVVAIAPATGTLLWKIPFPDEWHENIVTPTMAGDVLVVSSPRAGTIGYRIEKAGASWRATEAWKNTDVPLYMSSPVADGTFLYGFSNKRKGQLFCLDATTGAVKWTTEGRGGDNAAIQLAGDHLMVLTTGGDLLILRRNPSRYDEVRRYRVADGATWGHPALTPQAVVIRDAASIAAWALK